MRSAADIRSTQDTWIVNGDHGFSPTSDVIDVGSSGTTLYFLVGLAALSDRPVQIVGQRYFRRRPIGPLLRALQRLGIKLEYEGQSVPVTVLSGPAARRLDPDRRDPLAVDLRPAAAGAVRL